MWQFLLLSSVLAALGAGSCVPISSVAGLVKQLYVRRQTELLKGFTLMLPLWRSEVCDGHWTSLASCCWSDVYKQSTCSISCYITKTHGLQLWFAIHINMHTHKHKHTRTCSHSAHTIYTSFIYIYFSRWLSNSPSFVIFCEIIPCLNVSGKWGANDTKVCERIPSTSN